jgi:DNA-binding response OmpR family regulator
MVTTNAADGSPLRVLVVEDEAAIRRVITGYLEQDGFAVTEAADGNDAVRQARAVAPDVVVLDLGLPGLDGVEVCRQLRTFTDAYIIMLTARADEVDKLIGLSVGADDYLTKPFSARELVARIHVMLRRPRSPQPSTEGGERVFGDLRINTDAREVTVAGQSVALTRTEFDILDMLSAQPRRVHARSQILREVWGPGWIGDERVVDVHIAHLRAKLGDDPSTPTFIATVRGVGFRMLTGEAT